MRKWIEKKTALPQNDMFITYYLAIIALSSYYLPFLLVEDFLLDKPF